MIWLVPPEYVVIDIETIAGDPVEAEDWMRRAWNPNPNWKPATIGSKFLETYEKKREQLALLDSAPIISIALATNFDCRVVHCLACDDAAIAGVPLERCSNQQAMLQRVAEYLQVVPPETVLVGHNILKFDLPKLRWAMLHYRVQLPPCLVWRDHPVYDTMREWSRFTLDERQYISLSELLDVCRLENHKRVVTGAQVPELCAKQCFKELLAYAIADVMAEQTIFLLMTGQNPPSDALSHMNASVAKNTVSGEIDQREKYPVEKEETSQGEQDVDEIDVAALLKEFQS